MPSASSTAPTTTDSSPERLTEAASGIADQAGRTAERQASLGMDRAGDTLSEVARVVRDSGSQLRANQPQIADAADFAAQRVDEFATYLRDHDARDVVAEAERIARRQPALVIGGGLILGVLAGRFLRSGAEPQATDGGWPSPRSGNVGTRSTYGGGAGWTGGSSSDVGSGSRAVTSSSSTSRASGTTTPASGYGTGYGASHDTTVGAVSDSTADELAATDAAAARTTSRRSTARRTSGSSEEV